jgi:hypothetical protein
VDSLDREKKILANLLLPVEMCCPFVPIHPNAPVFNAGVKPSTSDPAFPPYFRPTPIQRGSASGSHYNASRSPAPNVGCSLAIRPSLKEHTYSSGTYAYAPPGHWAAWTSEGDAVSGAKIVGIRGENLEPLRVIINGRRESATSSGRFES